MNDAASCQLLFVYGTLLRRDLSRQSSRLSRASFLGEAFVKGALYSIGTYPGAVADGEGRIRGEVYQLTDFDSEIIALDEYEGCAETSPQPHEYRRAPCTARTEDGRELFVWIYWYEGPMTGRKRILSGNWLNRYSLPPPLDQT